MIECVPNFSEGRDRSKIAAIVEAIQSAAGVAVLGWEMDSDHNRSVVTFAGAPQAVIEGAVRGAGKAAELIHLTEHVGVHPRVGATDVIPFVPLYGSDMDGSNMPACIEAAHHAGRELWKRFAIPSYFYEQAALSPTRRRLEKVRRTGFDGGPPDVGDVPEHPTAGASMLGARNILIAYNVFLDTADVGIAQAIARRIRESNGGIKHVKAMGLYLESNKRAQVSMNLTNFAETDLDGVYAAIGEHAAEGELIGFIPRRAFEQAPEFFHRAANFTESRIIETRLAELSASLK